MKQETKLDFNELETILKAYAHADAADADHAAARAFGEYLQASIQNAGLTRAAVADAAGLSPVALYAMERGLIAANAIPTAELRGLAQVLNEDVTLYSVLLVRDDLAAVDSVEQSTNKHFLLEAIMNIFKRGHGQAKRADTDGSQDSRPTDKRPLWRRPSLAFGTLASLLAIIWIGTRISTLSPDAAMLTSAMGIESMIGSDIAADPFLDDSDLAQQTGDSRVARDQPDGLDVAELAIPEMVATATAPVHQLSSLNSSQMQAAQVPVQPTVMPMGTSMPEGTIVGGLFSKSLGEIEAYSSSDPGRAAANDIDTNQPSVAQGTVLAAPQTRAATAEPDIAQVAAIDSQVQPAHGPAPTATPQMVAVSTMTPLPTATAAPSRRLQAISPLPTPAAMTFQDYGVNPFIATESDPLSTFAIDVDTGSYTVARGYINEHRLPPPAGVRVEEFVNYFDYAYDPPTSDEVFAIHMDVAPAPFTETSDPAGTYQMMRVGIQGYDIPKADRADLALTFIIDVSGSMGDGGRMTLVKRALSMLIEELRPSDTVGIVVYTTNARVLLEPTSVANSNAILDAIYTLRPEDSTNVAHGLRLGYEMAWRNFNPEANNRVILASDGVANVDVTVAEPMWQQVAQYADKGITLTTVGVGMGNYNDVIMEQLADMGDGVYAYVDDMAEARRLFVDGLVGTLQTIAKDAKIQVAFNPDVVSHYRLLGYENRDVADSDFRNDTVDAGEIGAGHSVTALYEIKLRPEAVGTIATAHLRWQDPDRDRVSERTETLDSRDGQQSFVTSATNFQLAIVVAEFAESLRNSRWVGGQEYSQGMSPMLLREAQRLTDLLAEDEDVMELARLIAEAATMR